MPKRYEVLVGLNYPSPAAPDGERRAEAGAVVDDLPAGSVKWLLADGLIRPAADAAPEAAPESPPVADETPDVIAPAAPED